jgi:hypothetical protein
MLDHCVARWEGWEGLEDRRTGNATLHDFCEILVIARCAVLSSDRERWGL